MTLAEQQQEAMPPVTFVSRNEIDCPWCMADNSDTASTFYQNECVACGKTFEIDVDKHGAALARGILTDADKAYLAWKAGQ